MASLNKEIFACLDCETTGLEPKEDRVIEIAVVIFTFDTTLESFSTLINPNQLISPESMAIHHITDEMVKDMPPVQEVLPQVFSMIENRTLVGHGIGLDVLFLVEEARRHKIPCNNLPKNYIDTLRLARLYGQTATNSLEYLRQHFNIPLEGAHRAMNDVIVNIEVFKQLTKSFADTTQILERLKKPIQLKTMPLGKYKGRPFDELPIEYLSWAQHKDFDQDLIYSIKSEIKRRKKGNAFEQAANPFSNL